MPNIEPKFKIDEDVGIFLSPLDTGGRGFKIIPKTTIVFMQLTSPNEKVKVNPFIHGAQFAIIRQGGWYYETTEEKGTMFREEFLRKLDDGEYDKYEEDLLKDLLPSKEIPVFTDK